MQSGKMHEDYSAQTIIRGIRPEMLYKTGVLVTCFKGTSWATVSVLHVTNWLNYVLTTVTKRNFVTLHTDLHKIKV